MLTWERLPSAADSARWTELVNSAADSNPGQAYAWGEYKRYYGWVPERWVASDETGVRGCLQALRRRLPLGGDLVWAPGGPLSGFPGREAGAAGELVGSWLERFRRDNPLAYARFRSHLRLSEEEARGMRRACARPARRLTSSWTIHIDLSKPLEALRSAMASKHRYSLRQAERAGLDWRLGRSETLLGDFIPLYREMSRAKGIESEAYDSAGLHELRRRFGEDCLILVGYRDESPVTGCVVLKTGKTAFYLLAATGPRGREVSAAYAMVWRLCEALRAEGGLLFDFGGIDPGSRSAAGVDRFKRGFGGESVEYLGEWEWASSRLLRWSANALLALRRFR